MSTFTEKDRHTRSVIEVARILAGTAKGTHSGEQVDELKDMVEWLNWRLNRWTPEFGSSAEYDRSVRLMACEALALFDLNCSSWFETEVTK